MVIVRHGLELMVKISFCLHQTIHSFSFSVSQLYKLEPGEAADLGAATHWHELRHAWPQTRPQTVQAAISAAENSRYISYLSNFEDLWKK